MLSYVLLYRRNTEELDLHEFGNGMQAAAFDLRLRLDGQFVYDSEVEVVVFEADSMDALRADHPRYFQNSSEMVVKYIENA